MSIVGEVMGLDQAEAIVDHDAGFGMQPVPDPANLQRVDALNSAAEDLIEEIRVEQSGEYPRRQVWGITEDGRHLLVSLQLSGLREVVFKPDPFDLALTRLDTDHLDDLPAVVEARVATFQAMLAEHEAHQVSVARYLSVAERVAMTHRTERLRSEVAWHRQLADRVDDIIADERAQKDRADD